MIRQHVSRRKRKSQQAARLVEIYENIERIYARKGKDSLWPNQPFVHTFKKGAAVLGVGKGGTYKLREGDVVIRSRHGKRLWKLFNYDRKGG